MRKLSVLPGAFLVLAVLRCGGGAETSNSVGTSGAPGSGGGQPAAGTSGAAPDVDAGDASLPFDGGGGTAPGTDAGDASVTPEGGGGADPGGAGGEASQLPDGGSGGEVDPPEPVPCADDGGCVATGQRCDLDAGLCVECLYHSDCAGRDICGGHVCQHSTYCRREDDCAAAPLTPVCDFARYYCVGCFDDADCEPGSLCVDTQCMLQGHCVNSLDCPTGQVCDPEVAVCRDCLGDADCGTDEACAHHECVPTCASDLTCVPFGMLCDGAHCVDCLQHLDCPAHQHCSDGQCVDDVCQPGTSECVRDSIDPWSSFYPEVALCGPDGDGFESFTDCVSGSTCIKDGASARCEPYVCSPDTVECNPAGDAVITCSNDGLTILDTQPCGPGLDCVWSECRNIICLASDWYCSADQHSVMACNLYGDDATLQYDCWSNGEYCHPSTERCSPQVCPPLGSGCDVNWISTCNDLGDGFVGQIEDCAAQGLVCFQGACGTHAEDNVAWEAPTRFEAYYSDYTMGNMYTMSTTRVVTEFSQRFYLARGYNDITWVVWTDNGSGFVDEIFSVTTSSVAPTADGYYSSGPINITLEAGRWYLLGVRFAVESTFDAFYYQNEGTRDVTFGQVTGSYTSSGISWGLPDTTDERRYTQRIITDAPTP